MANQPEKKINAGAIQVSVWKNQTQKDGKTSEYKTVSFDRRYKDKQTGEWKSTNSLRVNDIPKAITALTKAYEHLIIKEGNDNAYTEEVIMG